jgi:hypothetical protein
MPVFVRHKSGTVAIDVHFHFERAVCHWKTYFRFRSLQQNDRLLVRQKRCGSNKTFLLTTRWFICAPNVRRVKRDAARTQKKSASLKLVHSSRFEFDPHRHWRRKASMCQYIVAGMISPWFNLQANKNNNNNNNYNYNFVNCDRHTYCIYNALIYWRTEQFTQYRLFSK